MLISSSAKALRFKNVLDTLTSDRIAGLGAAGQYHTVASAGTSE